MDGEIYKFRPEGGVETPYMRASQVWDERIGKARQQALSWRLAAFVALAMTGLMGVALVWRSTAPDVVPYIVEVGGEGEVRLVGTPRTQNWKPGEGVQRFFLREWVEGVRGISSDASVVRGNLLRAYDGATTRAQAILDDVVREENPFELIEKQTREVQITSMVKVGDESWRVEWTEASRDKSGHRFGVQKMVGVFELNHHAPTTKSDVEKNPLGLFIEHFSWSRVEGEGDN